MGASGPASFFNLPITNKSYTWVSSGSNEEVGEMTRFPYTYEKIIVLGNKTRWSHHRQWHFLKPFTTNWEQNPRGTGVTLRSGGREGHWGASSREHALSRKLEHHQVRPKWIISYLSRDGGGGGRQFREPKGAPRASHWLRTAPKNHMSKGKEKDHCSGHLPDQWHLNPGSGTQHQDDLKLSQWSHCAATVEDSCSLLLPSTKFREEEEKQITGNVSRPQLRGERLSSLTRCRFFTLPSA